MKTKEELEKDTKKLASKYGQSFNIDEPYEKIRIESFEDGRNSLMSEITERDKALDKLNEGYVLLDTKAKENIQVYLNMIDDRDSKLSAMEKENAELRRLNDNLVARIENRDKDIEGLIKQLNER